MWPRPVGEADQIGPGIRRHGSLFVRISSTQRQLKDMRIYITTSSHSSTDTECKSNSLALNRNYGSNAPFSKTKHFLVEFRQDIIFRIGVRNVI